MMAGRDDVPQPSATRTGAARSGSAREAHAEMRKPFSEAHTVWQPSRIVVLEGVCHVVRSVLGAVPG